MTKSANKAYFVRETGIITVIAIIFAAMGTVMLFKKGKLANSGVYEPVHVLK